MSATASLADDTRAPDASHRIAVAAHEIRTPLGGVLALADLLLAEDLSDVARGHASALKAAAEHLFGVATTLLGGAAPSAPEIVDLDQFLARVTPPIAARAAVKGLAFRASRAAGTPERVTAEAGALRQIVENLADNALRVTANGSIELRIETVGGDARTAALRIAVRDTGPGLGIAPHRLFAPYVQGDGAPGGAGLGLALVARLAERMGGHAEAADRPEGGAEVAVVLRLPVDGPVQATPLNRPLRVLIAEDNAINQRVLATLLDHFGHDYDIVGDGRAAVEAAAGGGYDLVLMDAVMPELDGLAATRAIRAMDHGPRVVGVTARAFNDEIRAFEDAGADAVVTKPISVAELWRAIGGEERRRLG